MLVLTDARAASLAERLDLDVITSGCLTFVAFPLDLGDEQKARREARRLAPLLWEEGLELATLLALESAKNDSIEAACEAIEDVSRQGPRSAVVRAIVWRLAQQLVEDMRQRSAATVRTRS